MDKDTGRLDGGQLAQMASRFAGAGESGLHCPQASEGSKDSSSTMDLEGWILGQVPEQSKAFLVPQSTTKSQILLWSEGGQLICNRCRGKDCATTPHVQILRDVFSSAPFDASCVAVLDKSNHIGCGMHRHCTNLTVSLTCAHVQMDATRFT